MYCKVISAAIIGVNAHIVNVEADVSNGLPMFDMVGLLSSEVKEARERVRAAIRNSNYFLEAKRITINLSPASLRKKGTYFDLAIALAILTNYGYVNREALRDSLVVGELNLNGTVSGVNGVLVIVSEARKRGIKRCFVPKENVLEGAVFKEVQVIGVSSLEEIVDIFNGSIVPQYSYCDVSKMIEQRQDDISSDFSNIIGQEVAKRAVKIAVAGMHNMMLMGSPGAGKTMIAKHIPTILPRLTKEESVEISKVYSAAGFLRNSEFMLERPFRSVHHSATRQAVLGGGNSPRVGELSLAHKGVLFLDEYPEFDRRVLEALRQPLEDNEVIISRVNYKYVFPAEVMLVTAMNMCRCGYYPDRSRCKCTVYDINKYLGKLSGALLDRIDVGIYMENIELEKIINHKKQETSSDIRKEVEAVRLIQANRFENTDIRFNSRIATELIDKYCVVSRKGRVLLNEMYKKTRMSMRAYYKIIKVARTIADLSEESIIGEEHIAEAFGYRMDNVKEGVKY